MKASLSYQDDPRNGNLPLEGLLINCVILEELSASDLERLSASDCYRFQIIHIVTSKFK